MFVATNNRSLEDQSAIKQQTERFEFKNKTC